MTVQQGIAVVALGVALLSHVTDGSDTRHAPPSVARRLAPQALQQDGRVTLSPGFSPDGGTMYFAQSECAPIWECPQRLKRTRWTASGWSMPEPIALPGPGRSEAPSVSPDGRTLFFSWATQRARHRGRDVREDFDLNALDLTDPKAVPVPIDDTDINRIRGGAIKTTQFVNNETAPTLTKSGDLYFWTERLDGIGERDVYVARSNGRGGFQRPRPLPPPINSPARDDGAWVSSDGRTMLVTYVERGGEGGSDLFISVLRKGRWSKPVNLGPTVNSSFDEGGGRIAPDGRSIVFTSDRPTGVNGDRIYQIWTAPLPSDRH
jgi:hypothetical protein